ncbi:MAG: OmpA family protein [Bacteroidota bacterium]
MKTYSVFKVMPYLVQLVIYGIGLTATGCFAQTATNKDALSARDIRDSVTESVKYPANISSSYWYKFTAETDTLLIFDIVPFDPANDYDFSVYKCVNANCALDIKNKKLNYIRICESVNYDKMGSTGLSPSATQARVGAGPGYGYAAALPVKAGETFYLKVIWPYEPNWQKGFKIYLYNLWPKKPKRFTSIPVVKAKEIIIQNLLFETSQSTLLKESYPALNALADQLSAQPTTTIEIKGHTDNVGDDIKNQLLSEKRAKAVFDYLISKHISANRLSYKGLGGKEPIANNDTEDGRSKNRRVTFTIISK